MEVVKRLFREVLNYKGYFWGSLLTGALMSLASGQQAILMKDLFDALSTGDLPRLKSVLIWVVLVSFVVVTARYLSSFWGQYLSDLVTVHLRKLLQRKLLRLNLSYHGAFESGSGGLMSRILNDVLQMQMGLHHISSLFREPILVVILLGWLIYLDWKLTMGLLVAAPLVASFSRQIARSLQKYNHLAQNDMEALTENIKETLDGVRVIQSFNLESEMEKRFDDVSQRYLVSRKKIQSRSQAASPITEYIATLLFAVIFLYFGSRFSKMNGIGDFMSYLTALLMLSKPLTKLQDSFVKMQGAIVSGRRVFEILDNTAEVPEVSQPKDFPSDWRQIEFRDVGFKYHDKWVLKNFNLIVNPGDVIALVGESGSGKSTAVNLLERFYDPTEGQILVDGTPLQEFSLRSLRHHVALVTQDVFLFNDSLAYNIRLGDVSNEKGDILNPSMAANAHGFIQTRDGQYEARAGDRGGLLSGGEKQRLSIARAFYKNAPILILDEATSALDSASEVEVQKGIESLMKGRTVFVIAHRLSTVVSASKILVMKNGEVIEKGNHEELVAQKGEYYRFRNLQST